MKDIRSVSIITFLFALITGHCGPSAGWSSPMKIQHVSPNYFEIDELIWVGFHHEEYQGCGEMNQTILKTGPTDLQVSIAFAWSSICLLFNAKEINPEFYISVYFTGIGCEASDLRACKDPSSCN